MADQNFEVNCGFFDAMNNDRLYSADQMNRPYKRLVSNGVFATPQVTPSTDLQVVSAASGMNIKVKKGEGIFKVYSKGGKYNQIGITEEGLQLLNSIYKTKRIFLPY